MGNLIWILLGSFLLITDYTVSKSGPIQLDIMPDPKIKREVVYFDKIEYQDGYYITKQDSIVNYYKRKEDSLLKNKR